MEEYYAGIDWSSPSDVRKVLDAYELHLLRLQEEGNTTERDRLAAYLRRGGFPYVEGRIEFEVRHPHLDELVDAELGLDVSQLRVNIDRMRGAVEDDPELAIGSSKELVEATCKAVLVEAGVDPPENADIPQLVYAVAAQLDLLASNVPKSKKGAESIKRVLGSLSNAVQGIAELRNLYGSGHGKPPGQGGMTPRHARLAVGAAATISLFLMETAVHRRDT